MASAVHNQPTGFSFLESRYSGLARRIARLPIGDFPTPLQSLQAAQHGLWIKRDDQTHSIYGGNKVRKLEYLLGDAAAKGRGGLVTFGGVGSNHALATALHARQVDIDCTCMLMRQRMTDFVETTLQRHQSNGTALEASADRRRDRVAQMRRLRDASADGLSVVPLGGTSAIGSIGYVNAAFELAEQWRAAAPPERIYVASGTMGTAAGLTVGLALLGWPTHVVAVRVTAAHQCNMPALQKLCRKITRRLQAAEPRIRLADGDFANVSIRDEFYGDDYAHATDASKAAVATAMTRWQLPLETTYTGKAMACLLYDQDNNEQRGESLFWHTYNGRPAGHQPELNDNYASFLSLCAAVD
ncbi:MAG: pyridoxal-phosphate dependent enzyme [Pseudomonadota bacterium]